MWRHLALMILLVLSVVGSGCSFGTTPKRMMAYLPPSPSQDQSGTVTNALPRDQVTAALVVLNDAGFEKSAPELREGTLQNLGEQLKADIEKQLPLRLTSVTYPEAVVPQGSSDLFVQIAKEQGVPFLLVAVLSSSEVEVFDRLPMQGLQQGGGHARRRDSGLPGRKLRQDGTGPFGCTNRTSGDNQ